MVNINNSTPILEDGGGGELEAAPVREMGRERCPVAAAGPCSERALCVIWCKVPVSERLGLGWGRGSGLVTEEEVCWSRLAAACYQPRHAAPSTSAAPAPLSTTPSR